MRWGLLVCAALASSCRGQPSSVESQSKAPVPASKPVATPEERPVWWCLIHAHQSGCFEEQADCEQVRTRANARIRAKGLRSYDVVPPCKAHSSVTCYKWQSESTWGPALSCHTDMETCRAHWRYRSEKNETVSECAPL